MKKNIHIALYLAVIILGCLSCKKYLDAKPDLKLAIPKSIEDFQSLIDNSNNMNRQVAWGGEGSSDNIYLSDNRYATLSTPVKNLYRWEKESISDDLQNDWSLTYLPIYYSNLVLEGIQNIPRNTSNELKWNNLKGSALFFRGKYFLDALLEWSKVYDANTSSTDLGIPLRLTSDFNAPSTRATVQQCYDQIFADLKESAVLLPGVPQHVMRPSKAAAYAFLSRAYLSMRNYDSALTYADKSLQFNDDLIDFNDISINPLATYPIGRFNSEVIVHFSVGIAWPRFIDTTLYNSYSVNDLRKKIYFKALGDGSKVFFGSYDGSGTLFFGAATDEMYLTRSECYAEKGNITSALSDLNALLSKRYDSTFVPVSNMDPAQVLDIIRLERRKELVARGLRWMDIKRLNKEGLNITLSRIVEGQTYTLLPNDNKYALPIPTNIIATSGIQQNPR